MVEVDGVEARPEAGGAVAKYTANQVAEAIIAFCNEHGDLLTNLKLQKLLYYTQGWHLGLYGVPLFDDEFQAWIYGPAVPAVYRRFQPFAFRAIELPVTPDAFPAGLIEHVKDVWEAYGSLSAYELERISQGEPPWRAARGTRPPDDPGHVAIRLEDMRDFFREGRRE